VGSSADTDSQYGFFPQRDRRQGGALAAHHASRRLLAMAPALERASQMDTLSANRGAWMLRYLVCGAVFSCLFTPAFSQEQPERPAPEFLFGESGANALHEGCESDPRGIASHFSVLNILDTLELMDATIRFFGCERTEFKTGMVPGWDPSEDYFVVYYPVAPELDERGLLPPILHELGHVYQLKHAGSMQALRAENESLKIEMGADFLAGLGSRYDGIVRPVDFVASNNLVGLYRETSDQHGSPEQRTSAFVAGFEYIMVFRPYSPSAAYAHFQSSLFNEILYGLAN
jgi:hypothetical protein